MQDMQRSVSVILAALEVILVVVCLFVSVTTYQHYVAASCSPIGASMLGDDAKLVLLLLLALPLAVGLYTYVAASAALQRRWAWVAAANVAPIAGVVMVLPGTNGVPQQVVSALLGPDCDGFGDLIMSFVALAIVALTSLAYTLWSPPRVAA